MPSPVRADFSALTRMTYLNLGTHGLMPEPALERYLAATARYEREGYFAHAELEDERERARARLAALLGAPLEAIALTGNANDGINLVAAGIAWRPGDEVLISDQEHPAIENPFGYLARTGRITLRRFAIGADPEESLANLEAAISPQTRLVAASNVSSQTGARLPAAAATALAHARGAQILVDATQALGQIPLDVTAIGCDYLVSNGHKWLLGPKGTGLLYVRPERLEELRPAHVGAGSLLEGVTPPTLRPTAARFEFGTRALPVWAGMNATLDWWESRGMLPLQAHMATMAAAFKARAADHPRLTLLTPQPWEHSSSMASIRVAGFPDPYALLRALWAREVVVRAVPELGAIRISLAPFTDEGDLDRLFAALDELA
ncbi:MAG: aminotransferase class V-fold PLP-dependent enzyme [Chloroflexi bacterium OHK40]